MKTCVIYDSVGEAAEQRTMLAEALTAKGCAVVVAADKNGSFGGVVYMPHTAYPKDADAVIVWGHSGVPLIAHDKMVVAATSIPERKYNHLNPLLIRAPLVCMSEWHAKQFAFAQHKHVIEPILLDVPERPAPRQNRTFLYASPSENGLEETLRAWDSVSHEWPEAKLELAVSTEQYFVDPPPRIEWLGGLSQAALVKKMREVEGLFYVNTVSEAFSTATALAELTRARCHILATCGLAGLAESVSTGVDRDHLSFLKRFEEAWDSPLDEKWYAKDVKDRRASVQVEKWMEVLFG